MEYLQAVNPFARPLSRRWSHDEYPVSCHVEKEGEAKFWDGGQCEILKEGTYDGGNGVLTWTHSTASPKELPVDPDDVDLQIALALEKEDNLLGNSAWSGVNGGCHAEAEAESKAKAEAEAEGQEVAGDYNLETEEDQRRDQELAKRFMELESVPHVPRVNAEIPSFGGSEDKQRLLDRLSYHGLAERHMAGDGNCQFRALSDQLYRTSERHMSVRAQVVTQLAEHPNSYSSYVPMDYSKYLENMARDGEWGDHVTLQAAADFYGMKISLITSFKQSCFIEIVPAQQKSQRGLYLSFWSEIHYNSISLLGDGPKTSEDEEWVSLDD